jgi:hypothetical protein
VKFSLRDAIVTETSLPTPVGDEFTRSWMFGLHIRGLGQMVRMPDLELPAPAAPQIRHLAPKMGCPRPRKEPMMRRVLVLLAAAATLLILAAGPASADPANQNTLSFTLNCGSAGTVDAVFELSSSDSFHIVQFSSNFLWKSLDYVTPDGQTGRIERGINGGGHSGLVTCTYTGAVSGNHYTVTGFFTP